MLDCNSSIGTNLDDSGDSTNSVPDQPFVIVSMYDIIMSRRILLIAEQIVKLILFPTPYATILEVVEVRLIAFSLNYTK